MKNDETIQFSYDYEGSIPQDSFFIDPNNYPYCLDDFEFYYNGETIYNEEGYSIFDVVLGIDAAQLSSVIIKVQNELQIIEKLK